MVLVQAPSFKMTLFDNVHVKPVPEISAVDGRGGTPNRGAVAAGGPPVGLVPGAGHADDRHIGLIS